MLVSGLFVYIFLLISDLQEEQHCLLTRALFFQWNKAVTFNISWTNTFMPSQYLLSCTILWYSLHNLTLGTSSLLPFFHGFLFRHVYDTFFSAGNTWSLYIQPHICLWFTFIPCMLFVVYYDILSIIYII